MQLVALLWLGAQSRSPGLAAGSMAFALSTPSLIFGPWVGTVADLVGNRRSLLVATDFGRAALAVMVPFVFVHAGLAATLPLVLAMGALSVLFGGAYAASLPDVIGEQVLVRANAAISMTAQVAYVAGASIGGFLLSRVSIYAPFVTNSLTFVLSGVLISTIAHQKFCLPSSSAPKLPRMYFASLRDGLLYLKEDRRLLILLVAGILATAGFAASPVALVVLVRKALRSSSEAYGLLQALAAGGLALGSLIASSFERRHKATIMGVAYFLMGLATIALGLSTTLLMAAALLFVRSSLNTVASVPGRALLQELVPSEMRGRILTFLGAGYELPRVVVLPLTGLLIDALGVRLVYALMGVVIGLAAALSLRHRTLLQAGTSGAHRDGP